ncbi:unnamed protein product [Closterium sp. Naga37s-1]|nr:unnamed protein product [Closterium sp. Naga37s-1]
MERCSYRPPASARGRLAAPGGIETAGELHRLDRWCSGLPAVPAGDNVILATPPSSNGSSGGGAAINAMHLQAHLLLGTHHPAIPATRGGMVKLGTGAAVHTSRRLRGHTTAESGTSPRALRAARRGEASQQHEQQQHEGRAGREGTVALGELAADAAEAGAAETGLSAAAVAAEPGAAALLEETDVAAAAEVTGTAREGAQTAGTAGGASAAETAAASDGGLISPAEVRPTAPPLHVGGGRAAEESQVVPEPAASPSPLGTAEVAAVVAEAARRQQLPPNEETALPAAESAGTPVAAVAANRQGHGRAGSGKPGPGTGAAACAARGKKLRAQPAPRRPGAGLGPGVPGPLLGWLLQGQSPQVPAHPSPSHVGASVANSAAQTTTQAAPTQAPGIQVGSNNGEPAVTGTTAAAAGTNVAAAAVGTRRSARLGAITWGPPRDGRTPWMPAGRGGNGVAETAGAAGRGQRGVLRGGMRGGRGGRNQPPRSEIPARTGPWRERHARPERVILQTNEGQEASDNPGADPEFMAGEEETSEEISLEDEEAPRRRNNPEPQTGAAGGGYS